MNVLKVVELFSGIGAQKKALSNINANYEVVGVSEWDVNAIISYDAIHTDDGIDYTENMAKEDILGILNKYTFTTDGKKPCDLKRMNIKKLKQLYNAHLRSKNLGDITKIDDIPNCDLLTYSYPCTDLSVAGKMKGMKKGSGTRSGLLWEVERLLLKAKGNNNLPRFLLMENVKNLVSKKFIDEYKEWLKVLEHLGYNTYYQVLNAKNYGIPQNRDRVFGISVLKEYDRGYDFPQPFDNGLRLKDILEDDVDEKYYIDSERARKLLSELNVKTNILEETNTLKRLGNIYGDNFGTGYAGNVWDKEYICPTLTTSQGGGREPHIIDKVAIPCITPDRLEKRQNGRRFKEDGDPMFTLTSQDRHDVLENQYRIRKLTPTECFMLMNFTKEDINKCIEKGVSNSQLYKQAGNSICVNVLEEIFKQLFKDTVYLG